MEDAIIPCSMFPETDKLTVRTVGTSMLITSTCAGQSSTVLLDLKGIHALAAQVIAALKNDVRLQEIAEKTDVIKPVASC